MARPSLTTNDFAPAWLNFDDQNNKNNNGYNKSLSNTSVLSPEKRLVGSDAGQNYSPKISPQKRWSQDPVKDSDRFITNGYNHHSQRLGSSKIQSKNVDLEFPSLNDNDNAKKDNQTGDCNNQGNKSYVTTTVWNKPPTLKSLQVHEPSNNPETKSSSIYKSLVPKATSNNKTYKRSLSTNSPTNWSPSSSKHKENVLFKKAPPPVANSSPVNYTSNMQLLTSSKFRQRKAKNEFLSEIRKDDGHNPMNEKDENGNGKQDSQGCPIINMHTKNFDNEAELSSSLEAEHRFLKQMGWTGKDEQPLTDEEIREYHFMKREMNYDTAIKRKQNLIEALSEWNCSGSRNGKLSNAKYKNITEMQYVNLPYDSITTDILDRPYDSETDSDLSSFEGDT